ncbi:TetR/AcrR family transcriptional regulator [Amycolatopsis sp. cg9]|uniref:TetR/AcrR family transcriptional regulator n=1 Tax=Amycolatopsis sp. cg9 TaxID=3238801 RepID=UPI003523FCC2
MTEGRLRRVPRQARSREKLARVLAAADRLLAEDGVEALTTTRVAAEAGVPVGTLYQYLPDREAITEALAEGYLARLEELMGAFAERAEEETWDDPVGLLVDAFAGLYRAEPGFRALWLGRGLTDGAREADRAHKRVMAAGVHRILVAQRLLRDDYPAAVACRTAFLAADAVLQEAFRGDGAPELLDPVKTMLRAYLGQLPRP